MKKNLILLLAFICSSTLFAQEQKNNDKQHKHTKEKKVKKKKKKKEAAVIEYCNLTEEDETRAQAEGKIEVINLKSVKENIAREANCSTSNIKIISAKRNYQRGEYTGCICGTMMTYTYDSSLDLWSKK